MRKFITVDKIIFLSIYVIALVIVLNDMQVLSDRKLEYFNYLQIINGETIDLFVQGLTSSSLMATWLPAQIHLLTGWDSQIVFTVFPCIFFSLMPAFTYLIARRYLNVCLSIISAALILASFYFAFYASLGRVTIGWGFLALTIWAVLEKRYVVGSIASIMLVLSHYGTSFHLMFALGITWALILVMWLIKRQYAQELKATSIIFAVLCISISIWYFGIASPTGGVIKGFVEQSVTLRSQTLERPRPSRPEVPEEEMQELIKEFKEDSRIDNFFKIESRENVVQAAFGKNLPYMNTPQKIELVLSWLIVFIITYGLYLAIKRRELNITYGLLTVVMYLSIVITVIIPHLSVYYGAARVYFTTLIVLAPCFVIGTTEISKKIKLNQYIFPTLIILFYYLAVSGILHSFFGRIK